MLGHPDDVHAQHAGRLLDVVALLLGVRAGRVARDVEADREPGSPLRGRAGDDRDGRSHDHLVRSRLRAGVRERSGCGVRPGPDSRSVGRGVPQQPEGRGGLRRPGRAEPPWLEVAGHVAAARVGGLSGERGHGREGRVRRLLRLAERDSDHAEPARLQHGDDGAVEQRLRADVGVGESARGDFAARRSVPGAGGWHTVLDTGRQRARRGFRRRSVDQLRQPRSRARAAAALARGRAERARPQHGDRGGVRRHVFRRRRSEHPPGHPARRSTGTTRTRGTRRWRPRTTETSRIRSSSATSRRCAPRIRRCTTSLPRRRSSPARRFRRTGCCVRIRT